MRKLLLQVSTQGVEGRKTVTEKKGWAMLSVHEQGQCLAQLSVDTFEGQGNSYKERESPLLTISFYDGESIPWQGTVADLKKLLIP